MAKVPIINKPLTAGMIELLMEIHEREILKQPPLDATSGSYSKGLILRNLVVTRFYKKKDNVHIVSLFLTPKGYKFLKNMK